MGARTIYPIMKDDNYKTIVTIEPAFELDAQDDDLVYTAASVTVKYSAKNELLLTATFMKILEETPYRVDSIGDDFDMPIVGVSNQLIHGDLSYIGLDGLNSLDIYAALDGGHLSKGTFINKLKSELKLHYCDEYEMADIMSIGGTNVIPVGVFYNLAVKL